MLVGELVTPLLTIACGLGSEHPMLTNPLGDHCIALSHLAYLHIMIRDVTAALRLLRP